jgi:hypothetical protein
LPADDHVRSGDTTKILPVRIVHVLMEHGPFLWCRYCDAKESVILPALADLAVQAIRKFRDAHAKCPPKSLDGRP